MPKVRIFRPTKTAMQSGYGNTRLWVMEFEPEMPRTHDPLMGWISSSDTKPQVKLRFESEAEAVAYAKRQGYDYTIIEPQVRRIHPKSYADNFKYNRVLT
ncbi:MAG TPA: ETC complex I subunit [Alphaproteobacteria bacterium]|nr:ETC complex I subunit [Alphaproteobacteria bacterium]